MLKCKNIILLFLMLLPIQLWGQQGTILNPILRDKVKSMSAESLGLLQIYDFLERYTVTLSELTNAERTQRLERDEVEILRGDIKNISTAGEDASISINLINNKCQILLEKGSKCLLEMRFSPSIQLVKGKNLITLEKELATALKTFVAKDIPNTKPVRKELTRLTTNFYKKNGKQYQLPSISNDLYYEGRINNLQLVYSHYHIAESVQNLLASPKTPSDLDLQIEMRDYSLANDSLSISYQNLVEYMRSEGCDIYVGISSIKANSVFATVFFVNDIFKYNHVMYLEIPNNIIGQHKGTATGDITLYIPLHNLLHLFQEYDQK